MRREWELDEAEFKLLANKTGATRLGFALLLKLFELEARFPRREDVPRAAAEFMAGQVKVDPELFGEYRWSCGCWVPRRRCSSGSSPRPRQAG